MGGERQGERRTRRLLDGPAVLNDSRTDCIAIQIVERSCLEREGRVGLEEFPLFVTNLDQPPISQEEGKGMAPLTAYHRTPLPPTGVSHALSCKLFQTSTPSTTHLITARDTTLSIWQITVRPHLSILSPGSKLMRVSRVR